MKVLVTGMAGFIGFHLAKTLAARGDEVVGIDNLNDYYDPQLKRDRLKELGIDATDVDYGEKIVSHNETLSFYRIDISDKETLHRVFAHERFDTVVNLAAQPGVRYSLINPDAYIQSNIVGFANILEGCRHFDVENLVFASSSSVYGLNKSQPFKTSDTTAHPVSLYAATKKSNEMMAHTYAHLYGIRATGLRFFTVYGPWGRPDMAPFLFTDAILHDRPIKVFNNGKMRRDFTYIDDIVKGIVKVVDQPAEPNPQWDPFHPDIASSGAPYRLYNIGNNAPVDLMDFIAILEKKLGKTAKKTFLPMQDGDVESTYADVNDLIETFGYKPHTDLDKGIEAFVEWFRTYYRL